MFRFGVFALCLLFVCPSFAQESDPFGGRAEMHGFKLHDFQKRGFPDKWHFVTVRYRNDTGEMRFTYANEVAWQSLLKGTKDFPDGAIFAKTGRKTEQDPAFASSAVPSGAKRFQFMVRDKKKFKETDGWGYVLFDSRGKTFPGEPQANSMACAACHRLVPDRGLVFSQPADLSVKSVLPSWLFSRKQSSFEFVTVKRADFPEAIRGQIPEGVLDADSLQGPLRKHLFFGTLDEIVPTLGEHVARTGRAAILFSDDREGRLYSLVMTDAAYKGCRENEIALVSVRSTPAGEKPFRGSFCAPKPKK